MNSNYFRSLVLLIFLSSSFNLLAQDIWEVGPENVTRRKLEGKLTGKEHYSNSRAQPSNARVSPPSNTTQASTACGCWIQRDNTWQIGQFDGSGASGGPGVAPDYRNDDWSTIAIPIPFNFCFYGRQITEFFLNNNGNISFDTAYSTFTANSFPDTSFKMIAPFWADVDTRGPLSGLVYYKIEPTHVIVQWENVGYFSQQDDKLNTFQLIITNGNDPILGNNKNVSFCYKDMEWTTGSASGGANGFGGTPATVGVNQGNGINYIQFGLFDQPGSNYDGPFGINDEVDWLDNQSFNFNVCVSSFNIPPVLNTLDVCDTIRICENSTVQITANYLSPEPSENTTISYFFGGMTGINVVSNNPGNTASIILEITGQASNLGYHTIALTASDNGVPAGTTNNLFVIEVVPAALPSFTFSPVSPVNVNTAVTFTNTTPAGGLGTWDFGDGSPTTTVPNPQHTFTANGTYDVSLTTYWPATGCTTVTTQQIIVASCATASFTTTNACASSAAVLTFTGAASPSATFTWDFVGGTVVSGSGAGPYSISWATPGNYNPTLTVTESSCSSTVSMPVTIFAIPVSSIVPVPAICAGDAPGISFNGSAGGGATYSWNFGAGVVQSGTGAGPYTVQWSAAGSDQVSLIVDENGCSDTTQINIVINPIPTSLFTSPASACSDEIITVGYTGSANASASYNWDFNGAFISSGSGQGPFDISWSSGGNYNITLTVTENGCNSAPSSLPVAITQSPTASISPVNSICEGDISIITFDGIAGATASYQWNFGNGTLISGSGSGPYNVQWSSAGQDQVGLIIDENGCVDTTQTNVNVFAIPTSDFVINNAACVNQPISINYTGSASTAGNYNWMFGTGTVVSGSGQGPYTLTWNTPGNYQLSLIVTENGCVSTQTDISATVNQLPFVFAGLDQSECSGVGVGIGSPPVPGETYQWSPSAFLSDAFISNPVAAPVNNGNATLTQNYIMSATDANGCINSDTVAVTVYPAPAIQFTKPQSQCIKDNVVSFAAYANIPSGVNYTWILTPESGLSFSTDQSFSTSYNSTGTFPVTLMADYNGCTAQPYTDSVSIYEMPVPDFYPLTRTGCVPLSISFVNSGTDDNYQWTFGDGNMDQSINPIHVYQQAGVYSVTLRATNEFGCSEDTVYKNLIEAYALPIGRFIPNPQSADILAPVIQFQNYSTNVATYLWDLGDSTLASEWSPTHRYSDTGSYAITLMLVSPNGCVDTVRGVVRVEQNFSFYVPNAFSPNADGVNDYFRGYGVAIEKYLLNIYNRWGELIYTTDDYDKPWDGRVNNDVVQNDVYVYRIALTDNRGKKHTYVGSVSVVK